MNNSNAIDVLNGLIEINQDRIEGYETASQETEESDLKNLFSRFRDTSVECRQELVSEVLQLGGQPDEGTRATGKVYRTWMEVRSAMTGKENERKTILDLCEYGEDVAVAAYEKALKEAKDLTPEQTALIIDQHALIKADHDRVRALRDVLSEA